MDPNALSTILASTLSSDNSINSAAAAQLRSFEGQASFAVTLLRVAEAPMLELATRQAAATCFKNFVKRQWRDEETGIISAADRTAVKSALVRLMSSVPPLVQRQLSDALTEISRHDFPDKWGSLLPELVAQMRGAADLGVVCGVLETAASLFERFREAEAQDDLAPLKCALDGFAAPLLETFTAVDAQLSAALAAGAGVGALSPLLCALRLMSKCFFLLNFVDLPEFFEDHISAWMSFFHKYLVLRVPAAAAAIDDAEAGPVEQLQSEIVECVDLYAKKYEEEFEPFMMTLVNDIWQLLSSMDQRAMLAPHMDALVSRTIRFLGDVVTKPALAASFSEPATLTGIISRIVLPNCTLREIDLELLEDNPVGFCRGDIEGSASDTRRHVASDLVRNMCKSNSARVTPIVTGVIGSLLGQYEANKAAGEVSKDAAIALLMAVAIKTSTAAAGVTGVNEAVSLADVLRTHIFPELSGGADERPLARAACIKFVTSFRGLFGRDELHALLPLLTHMLNSKHYIVYTYAASAIERLLSVKEPHLGTATARPEMRVSLDALTPLIAPILSSLLARMAPRPGSEDNEYLMRCLMRVAVVGRERCAGVVPQVMTALTAVLGRVCRNPMNPSFNHYMFESIACLMRSSCVANPALVPDFEKLLFPPIQVVLSNDVVEFLPYSFQLLASLLDLTPVNASQAPLSESFSSLLPFILSAPLWQREGNIPGLTALLCCYVRKAFSHISRVGALPQLLGIWQGLTTKKNCEQYGFALFNALAESAPIDALRPHLPIIFSQMTARLVQTSSLRLLREFFRSVGIMCGVHGAVAFAGAYEANEFFNVVGGLIAPQAHHVVGARNRRETAIGLVRLLCESHQLLADANSQSLWAKLLATTVSLVDSAGGGAAEDTAGQQEDTSALDDSEKPMEFTATHVRLIYATIAERYVFASLPAPHAFLIQNLQQLMQGASQATVSALLRSSPVIEKLRSLGLT